MTHTVELSDFTDYVVATELASSISCEKGAINKKLQVLFNVFTKETTYVVINKTTSNSEEFEYLSEAIDSYNRI